MKLKRSTDSAFEPSKCGIELIIIYWRFSAMDYVDDVMLSTKYETYLGSVLVFASHFIFDIKLDRSEASEIGVEYVTSILASHHLFWGI